jgi:hypothetical protein
VRHGGELKWQTAAGERKNFNGSREGRDVSEGILTAMKLISPLQPSRSSRDRHIYRLADNATHV